MSKFILFDVGANWGDGSLKATRENPHYEAWVFEPTPTLLTYLEDHSKEFSDRYHILPYAVSDYDGISKFNIEGMGWGCSSLNEFNDNLHITWPGRDNFKVTEVIDVKVFRLDTWFKENNIVLDKIDFFKCDTQGSDLKVLQGMGDYIHLIKEGVVECALNSNVKLYKENHTVTEMTDFLTANGFVITKQESNDQWSNEVNIYFTKK